MKKRLQKYLHFLLAFVLLTNYFAPIFVSAEEASTYQVKVVNSDGTSEVLGTYTSYTEANYKMKAHQSSANSVAAIYQDGKVINANYAIVKFDGLDANTNLYLDSSGKQAYTYTNRAYGTDAAFLDYDPNTKMVKIKLSGFTGWVTSSVLTIVPISELYGVSVKFHYTINVRSGTSVSSTRLGSVTSGQTKKYYEKTTNEGYTWYKISYGDSYGWVASTSDWTEEISSCSLQTFYEPYSKSHNLIHYFEYGSRSNQTYTNLGPKPSYLEDGVTYYSFDGNYFYKDLVTMLNDYKNDTYQNALNKDTPFYAYYLYLPTHSKTGYTKEDLDYIIEQKGYTKTKEAGVTYVDESGNFINGISTSGISLLYKTGDYFIKSQELYGVNAMLSFSAAMNESATGTSALAFAKNNLFGHGAADSCWFSCATTYSSVEESIYAHAKMTGSGYSNIYDSRYFGAHYGNKGSGMNVKYASDPYWGEKMAANYYVNIDLAYGMQDYQSNTIGIKQSSNDIAIYKSPSTSAAVIYTVKNTSYGYSVSNVPMIVFDKVYENGEYWYMVYTDVALDDNQNINTSLDYNFSKSYGYVKASDLYVSNSQPEISASDKTVDANSTLNLLDGVSASDKEDGTIDVSIISSNVDTKTPGTYKVTYEAVDSGNFRVRKTITVTVKEADTPTISASNQTIEQNTSFDSKNGVTAKDYDGMDLTSKIKVTGEVNTKVVGTYTLTYEVTNSKGKTATKTITVTVKKTSVVEGKTLKDGVFSFSSLKNVDGSLILKGFQTISGIQNNLSTNIQYKVLFTNEDTGEVIEQSLSRITDPSSMPYEIESENGYEYKYAWFEGPIDVAALPNGNYSLSIVAYTDTYYSQSTISNVFGFDMESTFKSHKNTVFIRNNYESREAPIQFFVRDSLIGSKNASSSYNIENEYYKISYENNLLNIKGVSHIIGGNYSNDTNVTRSITFENISTYKRYTYEVGSITNGDYTVELRVSDGYDKTRAWFDAKLDVSNLEKGTYAIYISTSSNVSDFGELRDIFSNKISTSWEQNGKKYSFRVVDSKRYRVELVVE